MSRDAIRQSLAHGSLRQPIGQNLAYCVLSLQIGSVQLRRRKLARMDDDAKVCATQSFYLMGIVHGHYNQKENAPDANRKNIEGA
jgi:hypothetical protein